MTHNDNNKLGSATSFQITLELVKSLEANSRLLSGKLEAMAEPVTAAPWASEVEGGGVGGLRRGLGGCPEAKPQGGQSLKRSLFLGLRRPGFGSVLKKIFKDPKSQRNTNGKAAQVVLESSLHSRGA